VTSRPEFYRGSKLAGLAAVALFAVIAYVVLTANFPSNVGFTGDVSITANLGYLMFDMVEQASVRGEGFLVAFIVTALVLDAALGGSVMLATRDEGGEE
jgi:NADH-quinone oxidoreductase subunit J